MASVQINTSSLTHTQFLIPEFSSDLIEGFNTPTVDLEPGEYTFQMPLLAGLMANFKFQIMADGRIDYAPTNDGFLRGRGTKTLTVQGFAITLDGRSLSHDLMFNGGIETIVLSRDRTHSLTLIPGSGYGFRSTPNTIADFQFTLNANGQVEIDPQYAGFANANGQILTINGYRITIDGRALSHDLRLYLMGNDDILSRSQTHELTLLPTAGYTFWPTIRALADFRFDLSVTGQIALDLNYAGFATVQAQVLTLQGYPITIDGRLFSQELKLSLLGNEDVLFRDRTHELALMPGTGFAFQPTPGILADFRFDLEVDGKLVIAAQFADFARVEGRKLMLEDHQGGMFTSSIFCSLIQSDFGRGEHGNFEAVLKVGQDLHHFWRDNTNSKVEWKSAKPIFLGNVAGAGAIIQSDFKRGDRGNFEVVVPLYTDPNRVELWHFFHDSADLDSDWIKLKRITGEFDQVVGSASLIQSDFQRQGHGNFEVVVPLRGLHGHAELWHFFHDNLDLNNEWIKTKRITGEFDQVVGAGCIIQSDYKNGEHANFEVVVPLVGSHGHAELWHFYHDNANPDSEWVKVKRITSEWDRVVGPGVLIQSDFGDGEHNNFEVVVPIQMPNGHTELWHFFRETDVNSEWRRAQMITASASGSACLIRSDYHSGGHANFEVLVEECFRPSIVHYWRSNQDISTPWLRSRALEDGVHLTGETPIAYLQDTHKIVQLTGEFDRTGWGGTGHGNPVLAHNRTESRFGIRGTDLGISFMHKDRIFFLFGDTWREPYRAEELNLDSIAFSTDLNPDNGLDLTFYKQPPLIRDNAFSQRGFEVPLDGVSLNGKMVVFFTTDAYRVGDRDLMRRSVVAISDNDGYDFDYLYTFSSDKFINVSVDVVSGAAIGLPHYGETLLIFGSGRYRSSDVYLAAIPLSEVPTGRFIRYFAGKVGESPLWQEHESEAVPLFCAGCVGELSARWNRFIRRWLIFYNSDNPRGIVMRSAANPWGKWSKPVIIFDPGRGYGHFMHRPWNIPDLPRDFVHDNMFRSEAGDFPWRENEWGGEYGPYQVAPLARGEDNKFTQIYFTMSIWNPYQVVLMTTTLRLGSPELPLE